MLYESPEPVGETCDAAWNLAGALTNIELDPSYFQRFRQEDNPDALKLLIRDLVYEKEDGVTPKVYETLPEKVLTWLAWSEGIRGKEAVENLVKDRPGESLVQAIHRLISRKGGLVLRSRHKVKGTYTKSRHLQRYADTSSGEATKVMVRCRFCKEDDTQRLDEHALYEIATGRYVVYSHVCNRCCRREKSTHVKTWKGDSAPFVPVDEGIPYVMLQRLTQKLEKQQSTPGTSQALCPLLALCRLLAMCWLCT